MRISSVEFPLFCWLAQSLICQFCSCSYLNTYCSTKIDNLFVIGPKSLNQLLCGPKEQYSPSPCNLAKFIYLSCLLVCAKLFIQLLCILHSRTHIVLVIDPRSLSYLLSILQDKNSSCLFQELESLSFDYYDKVFQLALVCIVGEKLMFSLWSPKVSQPLVVHIAGIELLKLVQSDSAKL